MKTIPMLRALALVLTLTSTALHAQVPQIINYQGRVAVGDPAVNFDGSGTFKFALVDATGATSYWSNDGTSTAGSEPTAAVTLPVTKGLYSVLLGANMTAIPNTVFTNPDVRLRVWFDDGVNGSQLLSPDQRISSVGYAMVADTVSDGAITSAKLAAGAVGNVQLAAGALPASLEIAGNFQIAEANTSYRATSASSTSFTLPSAAEVGDLVQINGAGAGGWYVSNPDASWIPRGSVQLTQAASSADGSKLVGVEWSGLIHTSTDFGVTWTPRESHREWRDVASSADGSKLVAVVANGQIHTSTDSGVTWIPRETNRNWSSVVSSADGTNLVAAVKDGPNGSYTSTDSGVTWTPSAFGYWDRMASSADGTKLVGVSWNGYIQTSTDSGATWTARSNAGGRTWVDVACSADGSTIAAVVGGYPGNDQIFVSSDSGVTWSLKGANRNWRSVACSADGTQLFAGVGGGFLYRSTDLGETWVEDSTTGYWNSIALSADGSKAAACASLIHTLDAWSFEGAQGTTATFQHLGGGEWVGLAETQIGAAAVGQIQIAQGAVGSSQLTRGALATPLSVADRYFGATANTSYLASLPSFNSFILPEVAEVGDLVQITGTGTGGWNAANPKLAWTPRETSRDWQAVASSADGNNLVAVDGGELGSGRIYTSTDFGATWIPRETDRDWRGVASSADGTKLYAFTYATGPIYFSDDSGVTWTPRPHSREWRSVECSADGTVMIGLTNFLIYVSEDSAVTWLHTTLNTGPQQLDWQAAAISADGTKLVAVALNDQIYTSDDSGATWTARESDRAWKDVASSADGTKLIALDNAGIYTSTDSGVTWTRNNNGAPFLTDVASSSDGNRLVGVRSGLYVFSSLDAGLTWTEMENDPNARYWTSVAMSSDGTRLVAAVSPGQLYTLEFPIFGGGQGTTATLQYLGFGVWDSVDQTQIADGVIGSAQIADGTIGSAKIASGAIGNAQLATGTVLTPAAIAGATQAVAVNTNYQATSASSTSITLPTTAEVGDVVTIAGAGAGGWSAGNPSGAWTPHESNRNWVSIASSADGAKLIAAELDGQIYTSTDSGLTWTVQTDAGTRIWAAVASSADGATLVAATVYYQIHTSTDSGVTWTASGPSSAWSSVASSADGVKLAATRRGGQIYTSIDSGVTWIPRESDRSWEAVASSADGTKLVAAVGNGQLYTSTDSGVTWTARESSRNWKAVSSSVDGIKLVAVVYNGQIYTSTDSGVTWIPRESDRRWTAVASSADGVKLVAGGLDPLYISIDSGLTWAPQETGSANRYWSAVASSADGNKLVASVGTNNREGRIYTSSSFGGTQGTSTTLQYLGGGLWGAVAQNLIAAGAVGREQLAKWAVGSTQIEPGAVGSAQLANNLALKGDVSTTGEITCTAINLTSDRNAKELFKPIDGRMILDKVVRLPITEWQYKTQTDARHIGPMAQDFRHAFALGRDERHITSVDSDGVALAAIQGLNEKVDDGHRDKDRRIDELKKTVSELQRIVNQLAGEREGDQ